MTQQQHAWNFPADLLEAAWGIIANAGEGDWTRETAEWQEAAARWRDAYHATLPSSDERQIQEAVDRAAAEPGKTFEAGSP